MSKNGNAFSFRKAFRGFKKEDVINYISDENKRFMHERNILEERISEAEWKLSEAQKKLDEQQHYYAAFMKEKEEELMIYLLQAKEAEAALKVAVDAKEEALAANKELSDENTRLHALIKGCEEQLNQYSDKIAEYEAVCAANSADRNEFERVRAENEYLRDKYKQLEAEFRYLADKQREVENTYAHASNPRETQDDPFRKNTGSNSNRLSYSSLSSEGYTKTQGSSTSAQVSAPKSSQDVTDKAISSIVAINNDVKKYMSNCVDEFDSYSKDVSDGITKLAYEISERCKVLDERIKAHKQNVSNNIDSIYGEYNSKN